MQIIITCTSLMMMYNAVPVLRVFYAIADDSYTYGEFVLLQ